MVLEAEIKVLVDEVSGKNSLPGLLMAAFSLCLHVEGIGGYLSHSL